MLSGLISIYFISRFLSPAEQGYYYTFNSLIALQIFVELGLNYAIIQFASHEMAHLTWQDNGTVNGSPLAKRRLQSLLQFSLVWFGIATILMVLVLLPAGIIFFTNATGGEGALGNVSFAWLLLVIFAALNLLLTTVVALLEGCGHVAQVAGLRLRQAGVTGISAWLVLSMHGGLFALAASSAASAIVVFIWLWQRYSTFLRDLLHHPTDLPPMNWRKEIWPFHWRIAVSWMSGYFITQLFNPLIFHFSGPVAAGQMGMSLQIVNAMNATALAWVTTKAPHYGQLAAKRQETDLDHAFKRDLFQSSFFLALCFISLLTLYPLLKEYFPNAINRLVPINLILLLAISGMLAHITSAEAIYLRSHKEEPFFILSVLHGITILLSSLVLIPSIGLSGAVYSQAIAIVGVSFFGGNYIYLKKRNLFFAAAGCH
ncbi:hypothetical protein DWG20_06030 [Crenobacter cavernae]|uniref:Polysaccharide biosynthesis protein C-terminal domain-containing protein n=1 Tax=Crenobacter cavernae TaxID=2290923 RepID=A0A345Y529_9NEIS|nr:hypothetical protein DWG20_06030 [Crenobacter cavernae]